MTSMRKVILWVAHVGWRASGCLAGRSFRLSDIMAFAQGAGEGNGRGS